jgi:hypothetical protein
MVLGGPRSATTWLANLLTTDTTLCLHDPLMEHTNVQLEKMQIPGKKIGISDTAVLLWPEWVVKHPAPKVILYRDPAEINASIRALGLTQINPAAHAARLDRLKGIPVYPWKKVFNAAVAYEICRHLGVPFCPYRFEELKKMNVQPHFAHLSVGREAAQELVRRLAKEIE